MHVVLGLGRSGKAAAKLLLAQGEHVLGLDAHYPVVDGALESLKREGMHYGSDQMSVPWEDVACLIVSPGISPEHPLYAEARARHCCIMGEVALALKYTQENSKLGNWTRRPHDFFVLHEGQCSRTRPECRTKKAWDSRRSPRPSFEFPWVYIEQPIVAVTGTNGKTTVALLIEHVLNACGKRARALGNTGSPLSQYVLDDDDRDVVVLELSSFQLETLQGSFFDAALFLNLSPDHLDRYPNVQAYAAAKARIQYCLKEHAPLFVREDVPAHLFKGPVRLFPCQQDVDEENAHAAWLICERFGVTREAFIRARKSFCKPPHRLTFVAEIDGVKYFDDSKATNVDAVIKAIQTMPGPVILLAGGMSKGGSYASWAKAFAGKVKHLIAFGQASHEIVSELSGQIAMERADALSSALRCAQRKARPGDCILLSPGCASYDAFRDYAHRGEAFQSLVRGL